MQCCGSIPLTNGSRSCYFRHWPSRRQQKTNFKKFFCIYFLKVHLHHFLKTKSQKEVTSSRNQGFSYYFCLMIEGSGSGAGSVPLTSGSGSGSRRPKNIWIRRIRIRIRNTAYDNNFLCITDPDLRILKAGNGRKIKNFVLRWTLCRAGSFSYSFPTSFLFNVITLCELYQK